MGKQRGIGMNDDEITALLDEVAQAEAEMKILMGSMTDQEKRSLLSGMDDEKYERWN